MGKNPVRYCNVTKAERQVFNDKKAEKLSNAVEKDYDKIQQEIEFRAAYAKAYRHYLKRQSAALKDTQKEKKT